MIEAQLFMPESWFDEEHRERCEACGVPADLKFQTKPEIGLELLKRAILRNICPFNGWLLMNCMAILPLFGMEWTH